jgi:large subunit ribosomal protein L30
VVFRYQKYLTGKMAKVRIKQVRSTIDRPSRQKATIKALGLGRINRIVEVELTPQIRGMIESVNHLVSVQEL